MGKSAPLKAATVRKALIVRLTIKSWSCSPLTDPFVTSPSSELDQPQGLGLDFFCSVVVLVSVYAVRAVLGLALQAVLLD